MDNVVWYTREQLKIPQNFFFCGQRVHVIFRLVLYVNNNKETIKEVAKKIFGMTKIKRNETKKTLWWNEDTVSPLRPRGCCQILANPTKRQRQARLLTFCRPPTLSLRTYSALVTKAHTPTWLTTGRSRIWNTFLQPPLVNIELKNYYIGYTTVNCKH